MLDCESTKLYQIHAMLTKLVNRDDEITRLRKLLREAEEIISTSIWSDSKAPKARAWLTAVEEVLGD